LIVKRHRELAKKDDWYFWGLFEKDSRKLVGHIDFDIFTRNEQQFANFGYYLHNQFYGYGYGLEAAAMGLRIAFSFLKKNQDTPRLVSSPKLTRVGGSLPISPPAPRDEGAFVKMNSRRSKIEKKSAGSN
jgi:hypothetical protein